MSEGSIYTDEDRSKAVYLYCMWGNAVKVAEELNIPRRTVSDWVNREWFIKELATIRHEKNQELDAMFTKVIELAEKKALERLTDGDYAKHDSDGTMLYKPVSAKDAQMIAAIGYDKRALQRGDPTSRTEKVSTTKILDTLTDRFVQVSDMAKNKDVTKH